MSSLPPQSPENLPVVAIVGVGLIGGSIAAALKQGKLARSIIGVGRRQARLDQARELGIIDRGTESIAEAAGEADILVFCTPVDKIVEGVQLAAGHCRPGTVITDAGSVKGAICTPLEQGLPTDVHFVGSHPLAGSEKNGFEFADAALFAQRLCVVTPTAKTAETATQRIAQFWQRLGAIVVEMPPAQHDTILAQTSHGPHLVAAALAQTLTEENRRFAATGFRDTTRIAAGDEKLWTAIALANADGILAALKQHEEALHDLRDAVEQRDASRLETLLREARVRRESLD